MAGTLTLASATIQSTPASALTQGPQNFDQAATADKGLAEIGTRRATGWNQPGECIKSAQRWVAAAGGTMAGGGPTIAYQNSPAVEVPLSEATKGDVFQYSKDSSPNTYDTGVHTVNRPGFVGGS